MKLSANCKINLGLHILRRRGDGYHELETAMIPVRQLCDTLTVEPNGSGRACLRVGGLAIDCPDEDNICMRAWRLLHERFGIGGVDMEMHKVIPFGAGLGGGSADGVAVLHACNTIFGLHLDDEGLESIAAELGSDTVFFVRNEPRLCTGRGEIMEPTEVNLHGLTLVVAKPAESVSTREAYAGVTPRMPELTLREILARPVEEWRGLLHNDFEPSVFAAHPRIAELKEAMYRQGAVYASMSGSGSAVFGLFSRATTFEAPFGGVFVHSEKL